MNTIPAQEIKRRGIAAVDDLIAKGDVHIIRNNQPQYVVLSEESLPRVARSARRGLRGARACVAGRSSSWPSSSLFLGRGAFAST